MAVYVDTSAWIALHEPRDRNHGSARARLLELRTEHSMLVTGWHTVVEFVDGLVTHYEQPTGIRQLDRLDASPTVRIEPSHPHRERSLELFRERQDWGIDLSDALSFGLMEALDIERAFTYDTDFAAAGFDTVG